MKWFLLLTLLPLIIISLFSYLQSRESLINRATNELSTSAHETKAFIDNWFEYRMMDISIQAENLSTAQNLEALTKSFQQSQKPLSDFVRSDQWKKQVNSISHSLASIKRNYEHIHDIFLIDNSANILLNLTRESDLGTNLESGKHQKSSFATTVLTSLRTGKIALSRIERHSPSNYLLSTFISAPLTNELGNIVGVIVMQIKLDVIYRLMVGEVKHDKSLIHYIMDENGLLQTPLNNDLQTVLNSNISLPAYAIWQQQSNGNLNKSRKHQEYKNINNKAVIGIFQSINIIDTHWVLITEIPLNKVLADANWLATTTFWLVLLSTIIIIIVIIFLSKSITNPLIKLADASLRVASGETELKVKQKSNDEIGQLTAAFNNMVDKRNQYQKELEQSNLQTQKNANRLSLVINNTGVGFWDWDLTTGLIECNPSWHEITGYTKAELIPLTVEKFASLLHPDEVSYVQQQLKQHIIDERKVYNIELRIRHKKGHWIWLHDKGSAVEHNSQNRVTRMIGTVLDITSRKKQEIKQKQNYNATKTKLAISKALNQSKPINDKLDDAVSECFNLADLSLQNKGGIFLLSEGKNELEMCTLRGDFSSNFIRDEQTVALGCCLCGKAAQSGEIIISDNCFEDHRHENSWPDMKVHGHYIIPLVHDFEGKKITVGVLFLYTPINPNASSEVKALLMEIGTLFTTAIVQDQAKKLLEQATMVAVQNSQLKSEFLASMSHEIRTPMNGVLGMLGLLLNSSLTAEQQHKARLAKSSAESLLSLINDILDFSKVEAGKMELEFYDFNLRGMLGEFAETMALKAQDKGVEIILDTTQVEQSMVKGDQGRIRQILTNIVGNAIKFTNSGEIIIRVSAVPAGQSKLLLLCSIQDSGIGIPANKIDSLFETFSQVDASTTRKYGGTGLGLAITKKLCQLMDGDINVHSLEGTGSTFEFSIVIEPSKKSQRVMPNVDITKLNILIVDNNQTNLEVLRGQLEHWGATVTEAISGEKALYLFEQHTSQTELPLFDIAFLDMQMPKMDGAELGEKIRNNPALNTMKLVMMTSITQGNEAQFFANIGFNAYFPKPATTSDLFNALAVVMDKKEQEQTNTIITSDYLQSFIKINKNLNDNNNIWAENTRILLVEDNRINQQVALGILNNFNLNAEVAVNGIKAIEALKSSGKEGNSNPFTLILMDCQMPEMDGYQASREIRQNKTIKQYANIPIIAMTANAMEGDKEKCLDAGMSDYIAKPIDPEQLKEKLQNWIGAIGNPSDEIYKESITKHYKEVTLNNKNQSSNSSCNKIKIVDVTDELSKKDSTIEEVSKNSNLKNKIKSTPIWDKAACLKRVSNNQALLEGLIGIFIEETPKIIASITQVVELNGSGDSEQYQQIFEYAHALKGVSGNLSGIALHQVASQLEEAAKGHDIIEINKVYEKLNSDYQKLLEQFERFLTSM